MEKGDRENEEVFQREYFWDFTKLRSILLLFLSTEMNLTPIPVSSLPGLKKSRCTTSPVIFIGSSNPLT
jgi:hypothetical protein